MPRMFWVNPYKIEEHELLILSCGAYVGAPKGSILQRIQNQPLCCLPPMRQAIKPMTAQNSSTPRLITMCPETTMELVSNVLPRMF